MLSRMPSRSPRTCRTRAGRASRRASRGLGHCVLALLGASACSFTSLDSYFACPPSHPHCDQPLGGNSGAGAIGGETIGVSGAGGTPGAGAGGAPVDAGGSSGDGGAAGEGPMPCTSSQDCGSGTCSRGFCGPAFTVTYLDTPDDPKNEINVKWIKFSVQINNRTSESVKLSDFTVRYYFTSEAVMDVVQVLGIVSSPPSNVAMVIGTIGDTSNGWKYLETGFESSAGSIGPAASSGTVKMGVHDQNFTDGVYYQPDDYSFQNGAHVTLYRAGTLVAGTEPVSGPVH